MIDTKGAVILVAVFVLMAVVTWAGRRYLTEPVPDSEDADRWSNGPRYQEDDEDYYADAWTTYTRDIRAVPADEVWEPHPADRIATWSHEHYPVSSEWFYLHREDHAMSMEQFYAEHDEWVASFADRTDLLSDVMVKFGVDMPNLDFLENNDELAIEAMALPAYAS